MLWMMRDLWKSNTYLWVEGACQLTWKIWFVGLRAAKNVDGGSWRLVITPWSMQRSAWRAASTWLGHPQWPLDNGHTLGRTRWSWETENALAKEGGGRSVITRRSVRDVDSSVLDPPPCIQSITVIHSSFTENKHWARSIAANDGTSRNMNIFLLLNTCLNLHHYFVGLGISTWPEQNLSFYRVKKKNVGLREVISHIMNSGCWVFFF